MDLKQARMQRNLSQTELAKKAGTTQSVISYLERNQRCPTLRVMRKIENALGVKVDWPEIFNKWGHVHHVFQNALHEIHSLQSKDEKLQFLDHAEQLIRVMRKDLESEGKPAKKKQKK